ncbi:hypothetical protein GZ77_15665 [Endozoicomonas montiporae]|uniref:Flagellar motor switch protein FliN-like C-terminal domain-containing protein n=2 Tax=Endozoicomonas montiporae TaxID=1027273 RepID=A0A081N5K8_9GAMM|nr:type III secretion system cytoplasmic ring protein SctQ [Endozoicomonas montiporae]AMO57374.1 type III secretion protein Q [Endozoicomonas montiporae CL-33]KEQ13731.1 hypothetical protein GZ77_15665 [Endozoicomonas montiporae]
MSTQPLAYKNLSAAQLTLSRLLCARQNTFTTVINQSETELEFSQQPADQLPSHTLHLELNGHPYRIYLGNRLLDAFLPGKLDHQGLQKLPDDLRMAVLNHAITPSFQSFSELLGISWSLQNFESTKPEEPPATLGLNIRQNSINTRIELQIDDLLLSILEAIPTHHPRSLPDIPFWATLEKGQSRLSLSELKSLETGDIVFLDQHTSDEQVIVRVNRRTAFLGELANAGVSIIQRHQTMDEHEHEELPADPEDDQGMEHGDAEAGIDLHNLPVNVTFEVGQQQLTLAELQGMQAGYVFELDRSVEQPVNIRANGKLIGHCELVQIENRLGARITHLHDQ